MKEKEIEGLLVRLGNYHGMLCYKFVSPGTRGVPDRILAYLGFSIYIELKTKLGRVSELQKFQIRRMRKNGMWVILIDRPDRIYQMINHFKGLIDTYEAGKMGGNISRDLRVMCEQYSDIKLMPLL